MFWNHFDISFLKCTETLRLSLKMTVIFEFDWGLPKFVKFFWTWLKFWTPTLLKPTYLSSPRSEFKYLSVHHIENFLNFLELTQLLSFCQFWRSLWAFKQNQPCICPTLYALRQIWIGQTDRQTEISISRAPVGAKNTR